MRKTITGFVAGAILFTIGGAVAAPPILAALPIDSCTDTTNEALSTSSETIFAANSDRVEACVTNNDSAIVIYIARGATATADSDAVQPGGSWCIESKGNGYFYKGAISGIAASGTPDIGGQECSR